MRIDLGVQGGRRGRGRLGVQCAGVRHPPERQFRPGTQVRDLSRRSREPQSVGDVRRSTAAIPQRLGGPEGFLALVSSAVAVWKRRPLGRNYRRLWVASAVSVTGDGVTVTD